MQVYSHKEVASEALDDDAEETATRPGPDRYQMPPDSQYPRDVLDARLLDARKKLAKQPDGSLHAKLLDYVVKSNCPRTVDNETFGNVVMAVTKYAGDADTSIIAEALAASCGVGIPLDVIAKAVNAARGVEVPGAPPARDEERSETTLLLSLVEQTERPSFFHTALGDPYATVQAKTRRETMKIGSTAFRNWLDWIYYQSTKSALNRESRDAAVSTLRAKALFEGRERTVSVRIAKNKRWTYLDLADDKGRVLKFGSDGWEVCQDFGHVRFERPPGMLALPEPKRDDGTGLDRLWKYVLVQPEDRARVLVFLLGTLHPAKFTRS